MGSKTNIEKTEKIRSIAYSDNEQFIKTDFEKVLEFESWMREKVKNIHVGKNKRMCRSYEIVIA